MHFALALPLAIALLLPLPALAQALAQPAMRQPSARSPAAAELRGTWPAWNSAGPVDPQPYPTGVDIAFVAGLPLVLSRAASLQRADLPPPRQPGWPSLVASVDNPGQPALTIRLLGVAARARPGQAVPAGPVLGLVADAAPLWPGIANHVTLEVYLDGKRVDPRPWLARLLPQISTVPGGGTTGAAGPGHPALAAMGFARRGGATGATGR